MNESKGGEIRHTIGPAGSFALRNVSGRVRLVGVDGDEVVVTARTDRGTPPELSVERSDGGLLVEPRREGRRFLNLGFDASGGIDFDVQLPRGAQLDIKTVSADIDAQELTGVQNYKTVSADVRLGRVAGRVSCLTVSGDVRLHDGGDLELDGATTSGDFTVEAALLRRLGVRTVSGDVRVSGRLETGPRHSVETVSGDLSAEVAGGVSVESRRALDIGRRDRAPFVVGDGAARLSFRSMSGDQHITLSPSATRSSEAPAVHDSTDAAAAPHDDATARPISRLDVLRALERGEIDVDEASRRLEAVHD